MGSVLQDRLFRRCKYTRRFIQYSAAGAYVEPSILGGQDDKIYVSLNYLQGKKVSYSNAYGAVDQDTGENVLYRYTPGDKLRVISHYTNDNTIVYAPKDVVFDVIGVEEIFYRANRKSLTNLTMMTPQSWIDKKVWVLLSC